MKKQILFLLFFSSLFSAAQNPLVKMWDKRFGGNANDIIFSFNQTKDGGYILCGHSYSGVNGDKTEPIKGGALDNDFWIVKTDSVGNKQWDRDLGGNDDDLNPCIAQTIDGGYIIGGYSESDSFADKTQPLCGGLGQDYWILKVDSLGIKQWDRDLGGLDADFFSSVIQTTDGGYIVGGRSLSGISCNKTQDTVGRWDYWILKLDAAGTVLWDKDFGGTNDDFLVSLDQTHDGGYILGGYSNSEATGDKSEPAWQGGGFGLDYWIIRLDSTGNKLWDKDFGGTDDDYLCSVEQTIDRGFVLGGRTYSGIGGNKSQPLCDGIHQDYWMVKVDSLGNLQWEKDYGGADYDVLGNVIQTKDEGYLLAGMSLSNSSCDKSQNNFGPYYQSWIIKTDVFGNKQWDKTVFVNNTCGHTLAIETKDGCYVIANENYGTIGGEKTQDNRGSSDYWIIKFCDSTLTSLILAPEKNSIELSIFPTPTSGQFTIDSKQFPIDQIEIFDLLGNQTYSSIVNCESCIVNCEFLLPGIYFVKATSRDKVFFEKIIKQ